MMLIGIAGTILLLLVVLGGWFKWEESKIHRFRIKRRFEALNFTVEDRVFDSVAQDGETIFNDCPECATCRIKSHIISYYQRIPAPYVATKWINLGTFCLECGASMEIGDKRNAFELLQAFEEERNPSVVPQGKLDDQRHTVALLEKELAGAKRTLKELEAKPRLNEAQTFRNLPPGSLPAKSS